MLVTVVVSLKAGHEVLVTVVVSLKASHGVIVCEVRMRRTIPVKNKINSTDILMTNVSTQLQHMPCLVLVVAT